MVWLSSFLAKRGVERNDAWHWNWIEDQRQIRIGLMFYFNHILFHISIYFTNHISLESMGLDMPSAYICSLSHIWGLGCGEPPSRSGRRAQWESWKGYCFFEGQFWEQSEISVDQNYIPLTTPCCAIVLCANLLSYRLLALWSSEVLSTEFPFWVESCWSSKSTRCWCNNNLSAGFTGSWDLICLIWNQPQVRRPIPRRICLWGRQRLLNNGLGCQDLYMSSSCLRDQGRLLSRHLTSWSCGSFLAAWMLWGQRSSRPCWASVTWSNL